MSSQNVLAIILVISGIAVLATALWYIYYSIKHKGDEKAMNLLTKAQAFSAWTVFLGVLFGDTFSEYFTVKSVGTFAVVLVGLQCLVFLYGVYWYTYMEKREDPKGIEE